MQRLSDERVLAAVESRRAEALATLRFVHEHPELGHEEHECSRYLVETLDRGGLEVARGIAGMPTAFSATLVGGRPGRSVGLVALYDAVPVFRPGGEVEPVHSVRSRRDRRWRRSDGARAVRSAL